MWFGAFPKGFGEIAFSPAWLCLSGLDHLEVGQTLGGTLEALSLRIYGGI